MKIALATLAAQFSKMDLFGTVPLAILEQLAAESAIETFPADAVIFRKDEPGHSFYLILKGSVKVHDGDYIVSKMLEGTSFGELALLDEGLRSMSVTTTQPTALAVIEREALFRILREEPDVLRKIVGSLAQRLRHQTYKLVEELRQREQELTRLVEERTAELNQQKEKAEAERQKAEFQKQRAEQSEQFEQQFLANMSHEIRTPMNAVVGMTNILLQKNPRPAQLKYLESIRHSSDALLVILNDILDISKMQAGRMELENTDFDAVQILNHVKSMLQFRAEEKGLLFKIESDSAMPPVLVGDPVRLQQILLNLAGNAIKFTEKGSVSAAVKLLENQKDTCRLRFEVRDTGIGMTEEQVARAFESFRQATAATTRKYGGTGLGLSISKQLVELFGGALEAKSQPGKGSTFGFVISLKISKKKTLLREKTISPDQAKALQGLRILIAEDNEYNRIVAVETLEMILTDVKIATAENGLEALEKVKTGKFDLVLMDVNMPEMDGLEATRLIRGLPAPLSELPVIAFTASVTKAEIHKCEEAGMNAVVPKPFKESELMQALYAVAKPYSSDDSKSSDEYSAAKRSDDLESSDRSKTAFGLEFLEQLTGGNHARIRKYLGLFLESVRTSLPKIETALTANNRDDLRRAVHTLKPQLKMVGSLQTADIAAAIEARLLDGAEPADMTAEIGQLLEEIRQSYKIFENHLRQQP